MLSQIVGVVRSGFFAMAQAVGEAVVEAADSIDLGLSSQELACVMAMQKFTLEAIQRVRAIVQSELAVGDSQSESPIRSGLNAEEDLPEPGSLDDLSDIFAFAGRSDTEPTDAGLDSPWFVSRVNPASTLLKLPGLWLKPGYRLVAYLHRAVSHGSGLVFALPETLSTTAHLEKAVVNSAINRPPKPEGAIPYFMEAIDGDRTAISFMLASLLRRELQEFGAVGKRKNWSNHRLIQSMPSKISWQWRSEMPKDWIAKAIVMPDGQAAVEFFSCRIDAQEAVLYRHLDRYSAAGYQPTSLDKTLAIAKRA